MKKYIFIILCFIILFSCKEDDYPYYGYAIFKEANSVILVNKEGGTQTFTVDTDQKTGFIKAAEGSEWCSGLVNDGKVTLNFEPHTGDVGREGEVTAFVGYHDFKLRIYQRSSGINHIELVNPDEADPLRWTATCSDEQASDGGGITMIFNDDATKYWHSQYSPLSPLPHWIIVDLKEEKDINQIRLGWRQYGDRYYINTKKTEILVSTDGLNYTSTGGIILRENTEGAVSSSKYTPYSDCAFTTVKARYVKLYITESNATNGTCNVAYFKAFMP